MRRGHEQVSALVSRAAACYCLTWAQYEGYLFLHEGNYYGHNNDAGARWFLDGP